MQHPLPNNNCIPQPSFNQNYMQQPMINLKDISNPTMAMNMSLVLIAKAFKLNYSTPTNNNQRISSNYATGRLHNRNVGNQNRYNAVQNVRNQNGNGNVVAARAEGNGNGDNGNQLLIAQKEEAGIQFQAEEFDLMAAAGDLNEIKEVNANCILMANLQQASTSGTQSDKAPVYDSDGSAEQAQQKQHSLYNGKVLLEKHDPPAVYDSEETLQLAQDSRLKMKLLNKEIKPANVCKDQSTFRGTDISKIIRKQSKTSKHGHENQKSRQKECTMNPKPEARKVIAIRHIQSTISSKLLALIGGTTIASSYPSMGACNIWAIVRLSAIGTMF
ncbi:hypothetical protein Tco_0161616 [Tanacetum coccineum]